MRIVAGFLGGRTFESPRSYRTHPMGDKIRGALFNALGDIQGLTVLDAFCGSGALSFEAVSRGAASAMAIDIDKAAITTTVNNIELLGLSGRVVPMRANISAWASRNRERQFDIVLLDPPYDNVRRDLLAKVATLCAPDGVVVCSLPPTDIQMLPSEFTMIKKRAYGDATLAFYRRV